MQRRKVVIQGEAGFRILRGFLYNDALWVQDGLVPADIIAMRQLIDAYLEACIKYRTTPLDPLVYRLFRDIDISDPESIEKNLRKHRNSSIHFLRPNSLWPNRFIPHDEYVRIIETPLDNLIGEKNTIALFNKFFDIIKQSCNLPIISFKMKFYKEMLSHITYRNGVPIAHLEDFSILNALCAWFQQKTLTDTLRVVQPKTQVNHRNLLQELHTNKHSRLMQLPNDIVNHVLSNYLPLPLLPKNNARFSNDPIRDRFKVNSDSLFFMYNPFPKIYRAIAANNLAAVKKYLADYVKGENRKIEYDTTHPMSKKNNELISPYDLYGSLLHFTAYCGYNEILDYLLRNMPDSLKEVNNKLDGDIHAAHIAAYYGHQRCLDLLLNNDIERPFVFVVYDLANPSCSYAYSYYSTLALATLYDRIETIEYLCKTRRPPFIYKYPNEEHTHAIVLSLINNRFNSYQYLMHHFKEDLQSILDKDISLQPDTIKRAVLMAIRKLVLNHTNIDYFMVLLGVLTNLPLVMDNERHSALHFALKFVNVSPQHLSTILSRIQDPMQLVNCPNDCGHTALHFLYAYHTTHPKFLEMEQILISAGANLTARDIFGKIPLDYLPMTSRSIIQGSLAHGSFTQPAPGVTSSLISLPFFTHTNPDVTAAAAASMATSEVSENTSFASLQTPIEFLTLQLQNDGASAPEASNSISARTSVGAMSRLFSYIYTSNNVADNAHNNERDAYLDFLRTELRYQESINNSANKKRQEKIQGLKECITMLEQHPESSPLSIDQKARIRQVAKICTKENALSRLTVSALDRTQAEVALDKLEAQLAAKLAPKTTKNNL